MDLNKEVSDLRNNLTLLKIQMHIARREQDEEIRNLNRLLEKSNANSEINALETRIKKAESRIEDESRRLFHMEEIQNKIAKMAGDFTRAVDEIKQKKNYCA